MTVLLDLKFETRKIESHFEAAMPGRTILNWADEKASKPDLSDIRYAVVWQPDAGLLASLPKLEVIFSGGAGVDHIFKDPHLPRDKPIVRFVDPNLTNRMSEWVMLQCLMHLRQQRTYDGFQKEHKWRGLAQPIASDIRVGLMGLGELGLDAAQKLKNIGFKVHGWSRSAKTIEGIETFSGHDGMEPFLAQTDMLVALLPLTPETTGILNRGLIEKLPQDGIMKPVLINAGRGGSQVEVDIISCLEDGTLGGVSLDVFEQEPLAADSPLWNFENAILTPHVAAESSIPALALYVAKQIDRYESGKTLSNIVDVNRGY